MTPNSLLFGQPNLLPKLEPHHLEPGDLRKWAKYLRRCKEAVWQRWTREYLRGLREQHQLKHSARPFALTVGEVVLIKSEDRNKGRWRKAGIVKELMPGRDGVVRAVKLRVSKNYLERAVQHLYPLELSCNRTVEATRVTLNTQAPAFRPRRDAGPRIQELAQEQSYQWSDFENMRGPGFDASTGTFALYLDKWGDCVGDWGQVLLWKHL